MTNSWAAFSGNLRKAICDSPARSALFALKAYVADRKPTGEGRALPADVIDVSRCSDAKSAARYG